MKKCNFQEAIDIYKERLELTQKLFEATYNLISSYSNDPDCGFDLDSDPNRHYGSVMYRDLRFKCLTEYDDLHFSNGKYLWYSEMRFSVRADGKFSIHTNCAGSKSDIFDTIEEMIQALVDWFKDRNLLTQDERDIHDIIT